MRVLKKINTVADPNPAPPLPRHLREIFKNLGLPVPERGGRVSEKTLDDAMGHLTEGRKIFIRRELRLANII
jgi:hypothetical protein